MPKQYAPDRKADALERLQANGGDVPTTAAQTGISERTLYLWRKKLWLLQSLQQKPSATPPQKDMPNFETDVEHFLYIRRLTLSKALRLADEINEKLPERMNTRWMFDRLHALVGLTDLILKLTTYLKPYLDEPAFEANTPPAHVSSLMPEYYLAEDIPDEEKFVDWRLTSRQHYPDAQSMIGGTGSREPTS